MDISANIPPRAGQYLFWPVTGRDFARSIAWSKREKNPVAAMIRERVAIFPAFHRK